MPKIVLEQVHVPYKLLAADEAAGKVVVGTDETAGNVVAGKL